MLRYPGVLLAWYHGTLASKPWNPAPGPGTPDILLWDSENSDKREAGPQKLHNIIFKSQEKEKKKDMGIPENPGRVQQELI